MRGLLCSISSVNLGNADAHACLPSSRMLVVGFAAQPARSSPDSSPPSKLK
jgi:hypothetical protein